MRTFTILFSALLLGATAVKGQTVATFDDLTLTKPDTFYVNYSAPGADVGFNDGLGHFHTIFDTSAGYSYWDGGFLYSNMTDSVTNGFLNQYSAKTAIGYNNSANYAVAYCSDPITFATNMRMTLRSAAVGQPVMGFYITNSTYAYNSMAPGYPAQTPAKKFGNGDWFLLTIKGYTSGALTADSVNFYLADLRFTDTTMNYIVKTWDWVNLLPLGHVDSLYFNLSSSDNGMFGMNTPAYFCMDNFTTNETDVAVKNVQPAYLAKVYPNPAKDVLYADLTDKSVTEIKVVNMAGQVMSTYVPTSSHVEINTSALAPGQYLLQMTGERGSAVVKFVK